MEFLAFMLRSLPRSASVALSVRRSRRFTDPFTHAVWRRHARHASSIKYLTISFLCLALVSCQGSARRDAPATGELAEARAIFQRECAVCHGTTGEGSPMMTQMVAGINLKSPRARALSDEQMRQQIANGKGAMPPFAGRLTPEQINALVKYIRQEIQGTTAANAR